MSASFSSSGAWIPLMDYAVKKGVSLSTLRRYIKAEKIKHRTESGRYLIWDEDTDASSVDASMNTHAGPAATNSLLGESASIAANAASNEIVRHLEKRLRQSQEEITELKMLVALYEEQLFRRRPSAEQR